MVNPFSTALLLLAGSLMISAVTADSRIIYAANCHVLTSTWDPVTSRSSSRIAGLSDRSKNPRELPDTYYTLTSTNWENSYTSGRITIDGKSNDVGIWINEDGQRVDTYGVAGEAWLNGEHFQCYKDTLRDLYTEYLGGGGSGSNRRFCNAVYYCLPK
ncbi:hypothetical protein BC829DRAFT_411634 [Chytridium lagenaria]|nr:hypothetical protein BC829DRAFT_411634 [Chytridium lagenaria]